MGKIEIDGEQKVAMSMNVFWGLLTLFFFLFGSGVTGTWVAASSYRNLQAQIEKSISTQVRRDEFQGWTDDLREQNAKISLLVPRVPNQRTP